MDYVTVTDNQKTYDFHVTNNTINFKSVKAYFTSAIGLTYVLNDRICPVDIDNSKAGIIKGVTVYNGFNSADTKSSTKCKNHSFYLQITYNVCTFHL